MACQDKFSAWEEKKYNISFRSEMENGHLIFQSQDWDMASPESVKTLIVGGGIAGLSAAASLPHQDFVLLELADRLGGTSSAENINGQWLTQGAHYDLSYPTHFGEEVLSLWEQLGVIQLKPQQNYWQFTDAQYIIDEDFETLCYYQGRFFEDVPTSQQSAEAFKRFLQPYEGKLRLPLRLSDPDLLPLKEQTFAQFLQSQGSFSADLFRSIDYQMTDDFGGTAASVSALAGLFYYTGRPYGNHETDIFSPPEGNYYFVKKLAGKLPAGQLKTRHLVSKITPEGKGFSVEVLDLQKKTKKALKAAEVVYAGNKHALKFICPEAYPAFSGNQYIPWIVANLTFSENWQAPKVFWQNEMLSPEQGFMGFVDSRQQAGINQTVLTAYFCIPEWNRKLLPKIPKQANAYVSLLLEEIALFYKMETETLEKHLEKVNFHLMGHAMPLPSPDYLLKDKNVGRPFQQMVYAGVDNGRLPLLFEAVDSGIQAVKLLGKTR